MSVPNFWARYRIQAYTAAKTGIFKFTQWLAVHMTLEYSPKVRYHAVAQGFLLSEQNRFLLTEKISTEITPRC